MADQGAEGLLSPFLRERRIDAVRPYLKGQVLDIGCGSGELSRLVGADSYVGFDIDNESLARARNKFPRHKFISEEPADFGTGYDTVVSMAVIEHASDPVAFLRKWSRYLKAAPDSRFVLTTPHPSIQSIHALGARIGLFSKHGCDEHEELLGPERILEVTRAAGLRLEVFKKFLLGMNQLFICSVLKTLR